MTVRELVMVGLGELLWDELPGGRRLGGAPANFAVMASRLGAHGVVASRVGRDEAGTAARALLSQAVSQVNSSFLQEDAELATGTVSVTLEDGQPEYTIHAPVAWDALELTPAWLELAARADAVCWGTLAQRDARSEETIHGFLAATRLKCLRVFDVNLRAPWFTAEVVTRSLRKASLLKLNEGEMPQLLSLTGLPAPEVLPENGERESTLIAGARALLHAYGGVQTVAITLGADGSLLVTRDGALRHPGIAAQVVDTVGAGDAFTAALVVHVLQGASLATQSEAANRWGAWVAGQSGAMPTPPAETLGAMEEEIRKAAGDAAADTP